uniref:hypothetical protein n=1 Tax=Aliarcobacter butzleri TaxID=28197 RepID=UPI00186A4B94
ILYHLIIIILLYNKYIRNLIITVFNFSNNEYLFDFIDDSISNNPEEIKDFVFRKYEDYMY